MDPERTTSAGAKLENLKIEVEDLNQIKKLPFFFIQY
jgi:hypothetical protein